ncbi:MAG: hypothetical protein A2Z72_07435 [Omnitrophica bacterium RBG_13_46_9]|nr:MAG: hypothetical protein A2Z72_07435 [Omnitrophica bacterium RBG_13_46_9]
MKCRNRHSLFMKTIAIGVVCLFLVGDVSFALAPTSRFKPLASIVPEKTENEMFIVDHRREAKMEERRCELSTACELSQGFHNRPLTSMADMYMRIYKATSIKVSLVSERTGESVDFPYIDDVFEALEQKIPYNKLPAHVQDAVNAVIFLDEEKIPAIWNLYITKGGAIEEEFGHSISRILEDGYQLNFMRQGFAIGIGSKTSEARGYRIVAEGPYPEEVLKEVAEFVKDFNKQELFLEPDTRKEYKDEADALEKEYDRKWNALAGMIQSRFGIDGAAEESTGVFEKNTVVIQDMKCSLARGIHMGAALSIGDLMSKFFERAGILFYFRVKKSDVKIGYERMDDIIGSFRRGIAYGNLDADLQKKLKFLDIDRESWGYLIKDYKNEDDSERANMERRIANTYKGKCYNLFMDAQILNNTEYDIVVEGSLPRHVLWKAAEYIRHYTSEDILLDPYVQMVAVKESEERERYYNRLFDDLVEGIGHLSQEDRNIRVFQKDVGFLYLSQLIAQAIHLRLSAEGLKRLIEKHLSHIDFTRFKWRELYFDTETGGFSLPYVRKDDGSIQVLKYYAQDKSAKSEPLEEIAIMEFDDVKVVMEDPRSKKYSELGRTEETKNKILEACRLIEEQLEDRPFVVDIGVIAGLAEVSKFTVTRYRNDDDVKRATDDVFLSETDVAILEAIERLTRDGKPVNYLTIAKGARINRGTITQRVERCERVRQAIGSERISRSSLSILEAIQYLRSKGREVTVKAIALKTGLNRSTISYQARVNQSVRDELESEGLYLVKEPTEPLGTDVAIMGSAQWFLEHGGAKTQREIAKRAQVDPSTVSDRKTSNRNVKALVDEALAMGKKAKQENRDFSKLTEETRSMTFDELLESGIYGAPDISSIGSTLDSSGIQRSTAIRAFFRDTTISSYIKWKVQELLIDKFIANFYAKSGENAGQWHVFGRGNRILPVGDNALGEEEELAAVRTFIIEKLGYVFPYRIMQKLIKERQLNVLHVWPSHKTIFEAHSSPLYGINICSTCPDKGRAIVHELMALAGFIDDAFNERVDKTYQEWRDEIYHRKTDDVDASRRAAIEAELEEIRAAIQVIKEDSGRRIEQREFLETDLDIAAVIQPHMWVSGGERVVERKEVKGFESIEALQQALGSLKEYVEKAHAGIEKQRCNVEHSYYRALPEIKHINESTEGHLRDALLGLWNYFPELVATCRHADGEIRIMAEDYIVFLIDRLTIIPLNQLFTEFQFQGLDITDRVREALEKAYLAEWSSSPTRARNLWMTKKKYQAGHEKRWSGKVLFELKLKEIAILSDRALYYDKINKPWLATSVYRQACHFFRIYMRERATFERGYIEKREIFKLNEFDRVNGNIEKSIGNMFIKISQQRKRFKAMGIRLNTLEEIYAQYRMIVRNLGSKRSELAKLADGPSVVASIDGQTHGYKKIAEAKQERVEGLSRTIQGLESEEKTLAEELSVEVLFASVDNRDFAKLSGDRGNDLTEADSPVSEDVVAQRTGIAADLADTLVLKALEAKKKNEKIVIGLDTSWIPEAQRSCIQGLLNRLSHLSRRNGLENIVVRRRNGTELARSIGEEIEKAKKSGMNVPLSNVVILGSKDVLEDKAFDYLRGGDRPETGAFFAGVQLPEDFPENGLGYIRLLEMLEAATRLAFGEEAADRNIGIRRLGPKLYIFIPKAEPVDFEGLKRIYDSQRQLLIAA